LHEIYILSACVNVRLGHLNFSKRILYNCEALLFCSGAGPFFKT
jgi:hypothetical protein